MFTYLFAAGLFLIVLFALNLEFLLIPDLAVTLLGAGVVILGIAIAVAGRRRTGAAAPPKEADPSAGRAAEERLRRPTVRLAGLVGGLYAATGAGILLLQAIGFLYR
jgi:hypothetical protein